MKSFGYKKMYIGGQLLDASSKSRKEVICPGTDEPVAEIAWATREDALAALESAKEGFKKWSALSISERTKWMMKFRDIVIENEVLLRESISYEMGKTYESAEEDYITVVNSLQWYSDEIKRRRDEMIPDEDGNFDHVMVSQPAGVVAAFLAWNFPLAKRWLQSRASISGGMQHNYTSFNQFSFISLYNRGIAA
jgi:succinate-semialdehyde dehydrogenase / glutarate-semialdehyde dehydrogenase